MKNNVPILALLIGYIGAITNVLTEAKSVIGLFAALASFVASVYAIALTRERLSDLRKKKRRRMRRFSLLNPCTWLIAIALITTLTGCAGKTSAGAALTNIAALPARIVNTAANLVTTTATNIVEEAVVTANTMVTSDPLTMQPLTNTIFVTNHVIVTNIEVALKPAITKPLETAQAAAGLLPPPYGEAVAGGLAIVSTLLAAAVKRRNTMLKTVIHGVESSGSKEAKSEISDRAMENGVFQDLHALVKKLT